MLEFLAPGFLYSLAKDGLAALRGRRRRLSPSEIVAKRERWRTEIEAKLLERRKRRLGLDVIIRDMKRINEYPDIKPSKKRISAWFRAGLIGTYHRGILVGLGWETLTADGDDRWRYTDYNGGEKGDIRVVLIGYVPYENIE